MKSRKIILSLSIILLSAVSCNEDGLKFNTTPSVGFESTVGTVLENNAGGIRVKLFTNSTVQETISATIVLNNFQNLEYGVDFTTEPALVDNALTLTLEPNDNELPSFFVYPTFNGKERQLDFQLTEITGSQLNLASSVALSYLLTIKSLGCPTGVQASTLTDNFNTCSTDFATPTNWIEAFEAGSKTDRGWGCRAFGRGNSRAPRASAFGGTAGEDKAWLIKNVGRIAAGSNVTVHFWVFSNFTGPGTVRVKWSSDYSGSGNPSVATWTEMTAVNGEFPAAGSAVWKEIEKSFQDICGENVYLAFQFSGATSTASSSWDIDDFSFIVQ
jgi:hypothetical protein